MVKNTVGGKKGKMMANKNGGGGSREHIRMIEYPEIEVIVCVTKVFGGGLFEVKDNFENKYSAILRGKMRGHNKRHNLVTLFSVLLVAKRVDTDPTKCDILFVYDSHDIQFLALNPLLNIANVLYLHNNHSTNVTSGTSDKDDLFFGNGNGNLVVGTNDNHIDNEVVVNNGVGNGLDLEFDINLI